MFPRSIWRQQRPRRLAESLDVRTPSRLRPLLVALFALAAALTTGACGGGSETVSTKLVSQAVNTTSSGSAFRISIGGSFKIPQLRAVSGDVKKHGSATVRGAKTTRYRAKVDLRRYPKLVPAAQRPAAEQGMKRLIQLTGTSTFPVDIWIDPQKRVRRIQLAYSFSPKGGSSSQKLTFNETVDIYDFGVAEKIATPPAGQTIDFTQLVTRLTQQRSLGRTGQ